MNDLRERWRTYKARVIPKDAPAIQMIECRRAFFAGAGAVTEIATRLEGLERTHALDDLEREVRQFRLEVAADRA